MSESHLAEISISPNPSNGITNISYFLTKTSTVNIEVYDGMGRQVTTLEKNTDKPNGQHQLQFDASNLPMGLYYITIRAGEYITSRKVVITQ